MTPTFDPSVTRRPPRRTGILEPGERLPSERELVEKYGTAAQTARQAVAALKAEGLVEGQAGRGVFVRKQPPIIRVGSDRYARWRRDEGKAPLQAEAEERGLEWRQEILELATLPAPEWVSRWFDIEPGTDVLLTESESLPDTLSHAIEGVMAQHADTCDMTNPDSPSSTAAIVREHDDQVDYLVLSDSPIVLRSQDGSIEVVHDNRNDFLPGYTVEIVREKRNAPGGFWVASNKPEAAYEALSGAVARDQLEYVGLFTDGASRLAERHGLRWAGLLRLLDEEGPDAVIDRVRDEDTQIAGHAPGKVHDDATAVLCRV